MSQISSPFQNLKTFHYKKNLYNLQGNKTNNNHIKITLLLKIFAKKYNFNYNVIDDIIKIFRMIIILFCQILTKYKI